MGIEVLMDLGGNFFARWKLYCWLTHIWVGSDWLRQPCFACLPGYSRNRPGPRTRPRLKFPFESLTNAFWGVNQLRLNPLGFCAKFWKQLVKKTSDLEIPCIFPVYIPRYGTPDKSFFFDSGGQILRSKLDFFPEGVLISIDSAAYWAENLPILTVNPGPREMSGICGITALVNHKRLVALWYVRTFSTYATQHVSNWAFASVGYAYLV